MSFILDALRKSEHERQRQTGPALVEVAVAAPKPTTNRWASVAIALLLVNLVAIGVVLLFKSRDEPATTATAAQARDSAAAGVTAPAAGRAAATAPQATVTQTLPEPRVAPAPPPPLPRAAAPAQGTRNSLQQEMTDYAAPADYAAAAAAPPPAGPGAVTTSRPGTVVYQSLPEANPGTSDRPPQTAATSNLPAADDLTARGALPELRLELHVWSNKPQERFVFINGHRYREGETTAEGATLQEITRDGVVMSSGGNRFLLSRD
jgi:general secretion pathway protein B